MKKYISLIISCVILSLATGCATITKTAQTTPVDVVVQKPLLGVDVDINAKKKTTGHSEALYLLGFIKLNGPSEFTEQTGSDQSSLIKLPFGGKVDKLKSAALHDALAQSNGDRLVDAQYNTKITSVLFGIFKHYEVTVRGHEAKITNIYQIKE